MDILDATSPCQKRERGTRRRLHFLFSRFFGKGDRICAVHCRPKTFPIQLIACRVRNGRTLTNVATVNEDGEVLWAEDIGQVSATVKECMAEIEANME